MKRLFDIAAEQHERIKQAFVGSVVRTGVGVGKSIVKNPWMWLGGAFTAQEMGAAGAKASASSAANMAANQAAAAVPSSGPTM